jgi:hypothetical protein
MGFFSWNCKGCGSSIRSPYSIDKDTAWMNRAVAVFADGSLVRGSYDGYGRLSMGGGGECDLEDGFTFWHARCFDESDNPEYSGPSAPARDQGFFVD